MIHDLLQDTQELSWYKICYETHKSCHDKRYVMIHTEVSWYKICYETHKSCHDKRSVMIHTRAVMIQDLLQDTQELSWYTICYDTHKELSWYTICYDTNTTLHDVHTICHDMHNICQDFYKVCRDTKVYLFRIIFWFSSWLMCPVNMVCWHNNQNYEQDLHKVLPLKQWLYVWISLLLRYDFS